MLIWDRTKAVGRLVATGWRFIGRLPNFASFMVLVAVGAWVISTFKDELKAKFFPAHASAQVEAAQPTEKNQTKPTLPSSPASPMPSLPEPPQTLPMPQLNALSSEEWIPLAQDGDIIIQGMTISYAIYIKLGDRPPVATLVVDGKQHQLRETGFANVIGANGKSCILKVKDVTRESLAFNLHCYN